MYRRLMVAVAVPALVLAVVALGQGWAGDTSSGDAAGDAVGAASLGYGAYLSLNAGAAAVLLAAGLRRRPPVWRRLRLALLTACVADLVTLVVPLVLTAAGARSGLTWDFIPDPWYAAVLLLVPARIGAIGAGLGRVPDNRA